MADRTGIEWCDATVNPWWGCTKIADECARCYAATFAKRTGRADWGDRAERWLNIDSAIRTLRRVARRGADLGRPPRVFIGSMCDILEDRPELAAPRALLFEALDELAGGVVALLLSKRIGNARAMMPAHWREAPPPWAWWGTSVGTQERAEEEVPKLVATPAAVRFLSCEPLLGPVDLRRYVGRFCYCPQGAEPSPCDGWSDGSGCYSARLGPPRIDWVIAGGESGGGARPMRIEWARGLRQQCADASVPFFFKQLGARPVEYVVTGYAQDAYGDVEDDGRLVQLGRAGDRKGGNAEAFPEDLRVREFPRAAA